MSEILHTTSLSRRSLLKGLALVAAGEVFPRTAFAADSSAESQITSEACSAPPTAEEGETLKSIYDRAQETTGVDRYELADQLGLTLVPAEEIDYLLKYELSAARDGYQGAQVISQFIQEWFGFPVSMSIYSSDPYVRRVIDNPEYPQEALSDLLKNICILPVEFYQAINVTSIEISDLPPDRGGDYDPATGKIRLDSVVLETPEVVFHEFAHAANMTFCGSGDDGALMKTLPEGTSYSENWQAKIISQEVFVENYGMRNYMEDAATIIEAWMTGRIGLSDQRRGTPIYEKLVILLDRLETMVQGIVQYVEEIVRPEYEYLHKA